MSYATKAEVASISQVDETTYVTEHLLDWVDNYINSHFNRSDFGTVSEETEKHSIENSYEDSIMVEYCPINSVTELKDNIRGFSPFTFNALNYVVDSDAGIIYLDINNTSEAIGVTQRSYFTKGRNSVEVTYTHGWDTVPDEIRELANLVTAKMARIAYLEEQANPGAIKKISMGDYSEERFYDSKFNSVKTKYDYFIGNMLKNLNKWRIIT